MAAHSDYCKLPSTLSSGGPHQGNFISVAGFLELLDNYWSTQDPPKHLGPTTISQGPGISHTFELSMRESIVRRRQDLISLLKLAWGHQHLHHSMSLECFKAICQCYCNSIQVVCSILCIIDRLAIELSSLLISIPLGRFYLFKWAETSHCGILWRFARDLSMSKNV